MTNRNLIKYIKKYGMDHIKFLMIQEYLNSKKTDKNLINKTTLLRKFYNRFIKKSNDSKTIFNIENLKDLEKNFENVLTFKEKRFQGAVYTPDYIIDNILLKSFDYTKLNKDSTFLDPACGSGAFLINMIKILMKKKFKFDFIVKRMIYGFDINEDAIFNTKILIELYSLEIKRPISSDFFNIYKLDFINNEIDFILKKIGAKKNFDYICSNPPYIKLQNINLNTRQGLRKKYSYFFKGSFSTSLCFIIQSLNVLSLNGTMGFITQNNFFSSFAAENLRKKIQINNQIKLIIDFADYKIFKKVNAYTALLFFGNNKNDFFDYKKITKNIESNLKNKNYSTIKFNTLNYKKWRLSTPKHLKNIYKIENNFNRLNNIFDIRVGIATLKDKVFFVNNNLKKNLNAKEFQIEKEITKKLIKINEFKSSQELKKNSLRVIFPYYKKNNNYLPFKESHLTKKFPKTFNYLINQKKELSRRGKGKLGVKYFYEWGRVQSMEAPGPKLLIGTFSKGPNFLLDGTNSLFCNGYSLRVKKDSLFNHPKIEILQKILNSIVMYYYAKNTSFQISGKFECYQKNFIEKFGIPDLNKEQIDKIKKLNSNALDKYLCKIYSLSYKELKSYITQH